jgi:aryl-alcohol dehydrogenase-like predicted oxidoreductase
MSSRALFGAASLGRVTQSEADKAIETYLAYGGNHIDTAASYGDAELRLGPWLKHNRKSVFLATKTEERSYQGAKEELKRSLDRMQVDSVDMWQMHVLIRENEWQNAMGPGGALEAFIEAREEGLVKWLGVTGHGLEVADMHLKSLARFNFDSVLLPWNWPISRHAPYAESFHKLHKLCMEKNLAFQLIKTGLHRHWREGEDQTEKRRLYEEKGVREY